MDVVTLTPREQPAVALVPRDPITTLRFFGRDLPTIDLPATQPHFTIGIGVHGGCDIIIPRAVSTAVSPRHAMLDRVGSGFSVRDLGSTNGTFASLRGPRTASLHVEPGDTFWIADVQLLVTDEPNEALRAHLACHLGLLRDAKIDAALTDIATGDPLLLLGPTGTGARRLAAVIHATSPHRANPRIDGRAPPYLLAHAHGATVVVDLDKPPAPSAREAAALFDPARGLRLVFLATDERRARTALDHHADRLRTITLVPLAHRPDDVPHLLQFYWATELGSRLSVACLGPAALRALTAYPWPRNLDELFDQAPRLHAYHHLRSIRRAAAALGITHQTLAGHLGRLSHRNEGSSTSARPEETAFWEGAKTTVAVNKYERDLGARAACLAHFGYVCWICRFDFVAAYGPLGLEFCYVHHRPLHQRAAGTAYEVDPIRDLIPICGNCHAMVHRRFDGLVAEAPGTLDEGCWRRLLLLRAEAGHEDWDQP